MDLDINDLKQESFSSFCSWKCLESIDFETQKDKSVFQYTSINNRGDEKTSLSDTETFLESFTTKE